MNAARLNGSASRALKDMTPMSKPEMRKRLAAFSFSEKIKILEKLRDRSRAIAASRKRLRSAEGRAPNQDQQGRE